MNFKARSINELKKLVLDFADPLTRRINNYLTTSFKKKLIVIASLSFLLSILYLYIVSHGDMNPFTTEIMGISYVGQWESLKQGRIDLDPTYSVGERFIRNGKKYIYHGIFPAFVRGFIEFFFKRGSTDWSRISTVIGAVIASLFAIFAFYTIALKYSSSSFQIYYYTSLFAICFALGSPLTHLLSSAYVYHEVIIWGLAWSMVFIFSFIKFSYSNKVSYLWLALMSLSCGCTLLARPTFSSATLPSVTILLVIFTLSFLTKLNIKGLKKFFSLLKIQDTYLCNWKALLAICLPLLICLCFQLKVNYEKWGNPFVFMDFRYYEGAWPGRLEAFLNSGGLTHYLRIPHALVYHFHPLKEHFIDSFPYLALYGYGNPYNFKGIYFDVVEPGNPIPINSFYIFISAILGLFSLSIVFNGIGMTLVFSYLISFIFCLSTYCLSLRYSGDLIPFFTVCSLASFCTLIRIENINSIFRTLTRLVMITSALVGIYCGITTTLQQKMFLWSVPGSAKYNIEAFYSKAENLLGRNSWVISKTDNKELFLPITEQEKVSQPEAGEIWVSSDKKTIFWYNGSYWLPIRDDNKKYNPMSSYGPYQLEIKFNKPTSEPHLREPLVTTGITGEGDILYVEYKTKNEIIIGLDIWGAGGGRTKPIKINPRKSYKLEISLGSFYPDTPLNETLLNIARVKLDNKVVLDWPTFFHKTSVEQIKIGESQIGGTYLSNKFSGEMKNIRRIGITKSI